MKRKDCDRPTHHGWKRTVPQPPGSAWLIIVAAVVGTSIPRAAAESVRLRAAAVVVDEHVRLGDVAELKGFESDRERSLGALDLGDSPPPAGSRVIHLELVRAALLNNGTNLATVVLGGATQCAVTRPSAATTAPRAHAAGDAESPKNRRVARANRTLPSQDIADRPVGDSAAPARAVVANAPRQVAPGSTLREAVLQYFRVVLARHGGTPELTFDRTSEQVLDLSEPTYQFVVRPRSGPIGLVQLDVEVRSGNRLIQVIPLVVNVSMTRPVVLAKRAINQGSTIQAVDVELCPLSFTRLEKVGLTDTGGVIGQRAKRFVPAGTMIDPSTLDAVPLVTRGQFVTVIASSGMVQVVSAGKALRDGLLGEIVTVRAADREKLEFEAVVVAPGTVRLGAKPLSVPEPSPDADEGERVARREGA